jgi:hypothetical protein
MINTLTCFQSEHCRTQHSSLTQTTCQIFSEWRPKKKYLPFPMNQTRTPQHHWEYRVLLLSCPCQPFKVFTEVNVYNYSIIVELDHVCYYTYTHYTLHFLCTCTPYVFRIIVLSRKLCVGHNGETFHHFFFFHFILYLSTTKPHIGISSLWLWRRCSRNIVTFTQFYLNYYYDDVTIFERRRN